jgi:hypothetical protein
MPGHLIPKPFVLKYCTPPETIDPETIAQQLLILSLKLWRVMG